MTPPPKDPVNLEEENTSQTTPQPENQNQNPTTTTTTESSPHLTTEQISSQSTESPITSTASPGNETSSDK